MSLQLVVVVVRTHGILAQPDNENVPLVNCDGTVFRHTIRLTMTGYNYCLRLR